MQATGYDLFVKLDFQQRVWCRLRGSVTSYDVAAAAGVPGGSSSTMGCDAGDTRWELGTVAFCEMYCLEPLVHVQLLGSSPPCGTAEGMTGGFRLIALLFEDVEPVNDVGEGSSSAVEEIAATAQTALQALCQINTGVA